MSDTYSRQANICVRFYDLSLDSESVAEFVVSLVGSFLNKRVLFVGGMFSVAQALASYGPELTIVDYTDEMVQLGRSRFPGCRVMKADLRQLPFEGEFDLILVIGRVFTHMITDNDLRAAIGSCKRALRPSGILLADNYEDGKIQVTDYFNGRLDVGDDASRIVRVSTTQKVSDDPFVVSWKASYSGIFSGEPFEFSDVILHRAFSRVEFSRQLDDSGLCVLAQGDNFDETSFYTLARKVRS